MTRETDDRRAAEDAAVFASLAELGGAYDAYFEVAAVARLTVEITSYEETQPAFSPSTSSAAIEGIR